MTNINSSLGLCGYTTHNFVYLVPKLNQNNINTT